MGNRNYLLCLGKPKLEKGWYLIRGFILNGDRAMLTCVTLLRGLGYAFFSCDLQLVHLVSSHHERKKKNLTCHIHTCSQYLYGQIGIIYHKR